MEKRAIRPFSGDTVTLVLMIALAAMWILPTIWVISLSLRPNMDLMRSTAGLLPIPFTLQNYIDIVSVSMTPRWLLNSAIVAIGTTVITLIVASLAGYAFARIAFPFKRTLFVFILCGLMIPEQTIIIPLHAMITDWGMHNTHAALIAPRVAMPVGVFLMTQFFRAIPLELEEAARLDNASRLTVFRRIMLPLSIPALTTLGIYTFLQAWNDFFWPLVSATNSNMYTVTVGLSSLQGNFAQTEGLGFIMASAVFASLPVVIVYVIFQKYIVRGIAMTTGK
ncbi:carbohydrate ABC transporter permease [Arsenicitalea aurantiaca]|uniref:sn-glycerol-3-phosphate transport system permease protein UgpE n=1 Tax=Arsenicitalea aurantiaca TaxID=1783274 RepID=A0A433X486_9HYPH|nr:carbohydrate ABC transporter permease [Arsenicitalea aurantiaca]RUT28872.1 carbohydrate ABC transporter permease [Arsenicitalea aurantiaca]